MARHVSGVERHPLSWGCWLPPLNAAPSHSSQYRSALNSGFTLLHSNRSPAHSQKKEKELLCIFWAAIRAVAPVHMLCFKVEFVFNSDKYHTFLCSLIYYPFSSFPLRPTSLHPHLLPFSVLCLPIPTHPFPLPLIVFPPLVCSLLCLHHFPVLPSLPFSL